MNSESLTLRLPWKSDAQIPLLRAKGIWFGAASPGTARADFDKQLAAPGADDVVFLLAPDKSVAQVAGSVRGLSDGKLSLHFEGTDRAIKQDRLLGLVFAAHPKIAPPTTPFQVFLFTSGDSLAGQWVALADGMLEVETPWQARLRVPAADLSMIRFRNGKLTVPAPDLDPVSRSKKVAHGFLAASSLGAAIKVSTKGPRA